LTVGPITRSTLQDFWSRTQLSDGDLPAFEISRSMTYFGMAIPHGTCGLNGANTPSGLYFHTHACSVQRRAVVRVPDIGLPI
jgi:hypothetical protein